MGLFTSADVQKLLHNKYVAVLGDSIQRAVYKDLVKLLQSDNLLTEKQLKAKGELSFATDTLVEGGTLCEMHNGTNYREVRQYRTGFHLVRFYFLTRVYSDYVESVLADFKDGPPPDILLINSCIWDLNRYGDQSLEGYKANLDRLFSRLTEVLPLDCLVIWNMTLPVGFKDGEVPEYPNPNLRWDIIEGNFYAAKLAHFHNMDVLDMHYHFRFDLRSRCRDAIHWNQLAHRKYTQILMAHIAQAWGVEPPETPITKCPPPQPLPSPPPPVSVRNVPYFPPPESSHDFGPMFHPGYTSFDVNGDNNMIGMFSARPIGYPPSEMNPNAFSPFVDDSPVLVPNVPPRKVNNFDGYVPMFNDHLFSGITIPPHHLAMPDIGMFHYNSPMPQEAFHGHPRLPKRRNMRPMPSWIHPYERYPSFPARN